MPDLVPPEIETTDAPDDALIRWQLLGPVQVTRGGATVDLGPPRQRALLALLLSRAGDTVALSNIVDVLWPDAPPTWAVNSVHRYVGVLRRLAEPDLPRRGTGAWLLADGRGYRLVVDARSSDLVEFRQLAAQARATTDRAARAVWWIRALELWRGTPAEDVADTLDHDPVVETLRREFAAAATEAAADAVDRATVEAMLPALQLAARANPTHEPLHAALMRALTVAGDRAAALTTFETLRRRLVDELGVSPGPELHDAYTDALRDEVPVPARPVDRGVPRQLPAPPTGFIGRALERDRACTALTDPASAEPVVLVTGSAGIGKTALAVQVGWDVASSFPDGQLYVDLRGFDERYAPLRPHDVLAVLLTGLGVASEEIPDDPASRETRFRSAVADRRVLLLLDNAADSAQVAPLLPGAVSCRTVVTSRRQLRGISARGAVVLPLNAFDDAESVQLLRSRLGDARVDADPDGVAQLTAICAGHPLTLGLVTARAVHSPVFSPTDLAAAIRAAGTPWDAFVDDADPRTDARAVLSWSYRALSHDAARMFRLLAVHPGPTVSAPDAAATAGIEVAFARRLLDELVDASLLVEQTPFRFGRHDLLSGYARDLLADDDPTVVTAATHRLYAHSAARAVAVARAMSPDRVRLPAGAAPHDTAAPPAGFDATEWLDGEHVVLERLVAGAARLDGVDRYVWQVAWSLEHYLDRRGRWDVAREVLEAGLAAADRAGEEQVAMMMASGLARALASVGALDRATAVLQRVVDGLDGLDDAEPAMRSEIYRRMSWIVEQRGDLDGALAWARRALAEYPDDDPSAAHAYALNAVGWYEALLGDLDDALVRCTAAVAMLRGGAHGWGEADAWSSLGMIHTLAGRYRPALACYRRALGLMRRLGVRYASADTLYEIGVMLVRADRPAAARAVLLAAAEQFDDLNHGRADAVRQTLADLEPQPTAAA